MTQLEVDHYNSMIQNSSEIAKQLAIANKLKRFELELKLEEKYGSKLIDKQHDSLTKFKELDECMKG
jgi:hypothetical protein